MAGKKGRSGRKQGSLNRIYNDDGSFTVRYLDERGKVMTGARVTREEEKAFKSLTRSSNKLREKRIQELRTTSPNASANYKDFGVETDFFYRKKSASFTSSHFKNNKAKERYLESLVNVTSGKWMEKKQTQYFRNYKQAITNAFGDTDPAKAKKLINKMNRLGIKKFAQMVENDKIKSLNMFDSKNRDDVDERYEEMMDELNGVDG